MVMAADVCTLVQIPRLKPDHEAFIRGNRGSDADGDVIILELTYGLPRNFLESISQTYDFTNPEHYNQIWEIWDNTEKDLIAKRPEHTGNVTLEELEADRTAELLKPRFNTWYVLNYPRKIKRVDEGIPRLEGLIPRLAPGHEKIIITESSKRLLEITYATPDECLEAVYKTYTYKRERMKQYNALQALRWFRKQRDLIARRRENQEVFVDETQLTDLQIKDMDHEKLRQRFRLYYMLRHPYNMRRLADITD